jgi:CubicO group peptidase (beta-lactamase class C family)
MSVAQKVAENPVSVAGYCDEKFSAVRTQFEKNFSDRGEVGASLAIYAEGELVVDLWGGFLDQSSDRLWQRDTLVEVFSATKGLSAACLHVLIDRGLLDIDAPVARYWPEFAANGKGGITVAMAMSHQAGLPFWQTPVPKNGLLDWDFATGALASEAPIWEPGTCHGYHGMTSGFIWGEIVRRITGKTIGTFLRDEIAVPLGADVWIGLPAAEEARVSNVILADFDPNSKMFAKAIAEPEWEGGRMLDNCGELFSPEIINSRAFRAAEGPATGGVVTGHGLARFYAPLSLDGSFGGVRIVSDAVLPGMRTVRSASSCDLMLRLPTTFTLAFSKNWGARTSGEGNFLVLGEHAFGTPGMGGSMGFADGDARMSFGYAMNRLGPGVALNERGQSLIDAAYQAIGYGSDRLGGWVR